MKSPKEQFLKHFDQAMRGYFQEDVKNYVGGRTRFALSAFITVFLSAFSLKTPYPAIIAPTLLVLWIIYVITNHKARFFVTSISKMKNKIAKLVNDLFSKSSVGLHYSNQKSDFINKKGIKDLKVFNEYGSLSYHYHNAITGKIGDIKTEIYNFDVVHSKSSGENSTTTVTLFNGSLYVLPISVPSNFYLSIMPEKFRRKARIEINGMDISRLFRSRQQKENKLGLTPGFTVHTNNEDITASIIDENIAPLFMPIMTEQEINAVNPLKLMRHGGLQSIKERMVGNLTELAATLDERLDIHRIEILVILNQKAYIFFPFRNKRNGREHPFDILTRKEIEPEYLWDDVQDMLEKESILTTIKHNASV